MEHLILAVVEAERIPCGVFVAITWVEELIGVASEVAQTFYLVFHRMRVYYIHNDSNAVLVGLVNELLKLLGGTKAAAGGKE